MTLRVEVSGTRQFTYTQIWDVDNRLVDVVSGTQHTQFFYDADGGLVRKVDARGTTAYIGGDDEIMWLVQTQTVTTTIPVTLTYKLYLPVAAMNTLDAVNGVSTTYYSFNGARVAMRNGGNVYWLHGDHLGSASLTTGITGAVVSEMRYRPFGDVRWQNGVSVSDHQFTGARFDATSNIVQMGARWYSPLLGRFLSPDSVVPRPGDSQAYNRYTYARNSPLVRVDPSGHADCAAGDGACWANEWMWKNRWYEAHGHFWDGGGWNRHDHANFRDWDILHETLYEVGILANNGTANWLFDEIATVAQGVVALMNKVGGSHRLQALLGSTVYFIRDHNACFSGMGAGVACVPNFRDEIHFADDLFGRLQGIGQVGDPGGLRDPGFIRGSAVHELAHVMDFRGQSFAPIGKNYGDKISKGENLGTYANVNQWGAEYFADAVAGWVYNSPDGNWLKLYRVNGPDVFPSSIIDFLNNELVVHP